MPSTYRPLGDHLARQPGPTCVLTFCRIEALLGRPLPPAASARRAWWSNHHAHTRAYHGWLAVGWRSQPVDLAGRTVGP